MEHFWWSGADAVGSDEVADPARQYGAVQDECGAAACQRRASVLQPAHEVPAERHLGDRRPGRAPLEDLRRHLPGGEPGHLAAQLLALRHLCGSQAQRELEAEAVREQHLQQDLLRRALSEPGAVRARGARPRGVPGPLGAILNGSESRHVLICVPDVLSKADVADFRRIMDGCDWEDGRSTAGAQSAVVKKNEQLPPDGEAARALGHRVISALTANPRFISAAIPKQIFPPLFNRYAASNGHHFGIHVDNAVRGDRLTGLRIRTDLSVTLFLSEPEDYDGGELVIEDLYGSHEIKLPAGHLVLYPASSLHMVTPVTRGTRVASFFWLQSMVRDAHARSLIFDLDTAIQALVERLGRDDSETVKLTGIYHNLIRYWAEV